ncbi:MAG: cysteine--tRNA ligase [Planctomycetes bacterium]|nr:cysteine--tRNA ligase [Planctomycetota bacterium]
MPVLKLKNTYTRKLETFEPLMPGRVTMYSCGPTVYSFAHIGNFRSFLAADILRRVLERNGYEVRQVMNITDVGHMTEDHLADAQGEDKLARAARELGSDPFKVAAHFEKAFYEDARAMRLRVMQGGEADDRALHPQATRHVPEMLAMIQKLIERGFAYVVDSGEVYYEVAKFPEYGTLSGKVIDELEAGARVDVREAKRDPRDFALWKVDVKHLMQWDPHSPKGWPKEDWDRYRELVPKGVEKTIKPGFPGWHIECSAMARAHLGPVIDIHTGGEDNIFPHHECEIAQSYGAFGSTVPGPHGAPDQQSPRKSFARYWVHGRHLLVDNKKMAKRDGSFFTVRDLLDPVAAGRKDLQKPLADAGFKAGVPANVLRYALIANQYVQPMNFSFELLEQARASVERIQRFFEDMRQAAGDATKPPSDRMVKLVNKHEEEFDAALNDNLNMPNALASVFTFIGAVNAAKPEAADAAEALRLMESFDEVLDVLDRSDRSGLFNTGDVSSWLDAEKLKTKAAHEVKHWAKAADREVLFEKIEAGELPSFEDLAPIEEMDAEAIALFVAVRQAAKKAKDFKQSDAIRDDLKRRGVLIEDTPQGVRWTLS